MGNNIELRCKSMLQTALGEDILAMLSNDDIIEIMLNPDGKVVIDTLLSGKQETDVRIKRMQSANIIKLVAAFHNQIADYASPMIASDLPFAKERFQGWLPPVVERATFAIRKRAKIIMRLSDYVKDGALAQDDKNKLIQALKDRKNIIVVGATSSGKTTFTNALLAELESYNERLLILEDLPELQCLSDDIVHMFTSPDVSMRDLVKGSLRMRPDRIMIGEVHDGGAHDLLKAWNTSHPGGICTIHANSLESARLRLYDLVQEAVESVPEHLIEEAVDVLVMMKKVDGKRKIVDISFKDN